jgi:integrase/recombinase XerD
MSEELESLERDYRIFLQLEKSLSDNTVDCYIDDFHKLADWLVVIGKLPAEATFEDLQDMVASLHDIGVSPRSQARIVSGIRAFYRFMLEEKHVERDPTELLETPKTGLKLPVFLTVEEINSIIGCIDLSKPEGHRNRAILETLYSCGLRVSELVALRFSDLFFDEGFIRVEGKGRKQRLVPVSHAAIREIDFYLDDRRRLDIKKGFEDTLFLNRRGSALTRVMIFTIIRRLTEEAGIHKTVGPHTFRHSFATHLLEGGANLRAIQQMLGHEKIATTEIYTHLDRDFLRSEILDHHPRNQLET